MKRFLAVLVAAMLAFSVCVPAFATNPSPSSTDSEYEAIIEDELDDVWYSDESVMNRSYLVQAIHSAISGYSLSSYDLSIYGEVSGSGNGYTVNLDLDNKTMTVSLSDDVSENDVVYLMVYVYENWVAVEIDPVTGEVIGDLDEDVYYELLDGANTYLVVLSANKAGSESGSESSSGGSSSGSESSSSSSSSGSGSSSSSSSSGSSSSSSSSSSGSSSSTTSPKTDDINVVPYVTLCVLALAGAVVAGKKAFAR
ncbi:MAG: hypothetical protein LUC35_03595 [Clostridiales bacterium]|nr:hypothetical protein [Clostridiales bacterium]